MLTSELADTAILASWARMDDSSISIEEFIGVPHELRRELLKANPGGEEIAAGLRAMIDAMPSREMFTNETMQPYGYYGCTSLAADILDFDESHFPEDVTRTRKQFSAYLNSSSTPLSLYKTTVNGLLWVALSQAAMPLRVSLLPARAKEAASFRSSSLILRHILTNDAQAGFVSETLIKKFEKIAEKTAKELTLAHKSAKIEA